MAAPSLRAHTDAVIAALIAAGLQVGNHVAPDVAPPYVVVYQIAGGEAAGTIAAPVDDGHLMWQVTSVGAGPEAAQWAADKTRVALVGATLTVAGRSVEPIQLDVASGGVERDDDVTPPMFYAFDRYVAWSFPS